MEITIDKSVCTNLEALQYEVESRKQVIGYMISANLARTESFEDYMKEYQEYFTKYEKAKAELERSVIIPAMGDKAFSNWKLDFMTSIVTID